MSPAERHRTRILAGQAAKTLSGQGLARPEAGPAASAYELERARLGVDLRRLKAIQSIERKIEAKAEMLPAYADWVVGVLAGTSQNGRGVQDDILVQVMIWRIDVGDYAGALPLIDYVLKFGLALPERFNRTAATLIVEEIADAALKTQGSGGNFNLPVLEHIAARTSREDMHDQVRAKLEKALAQAIAAKAQAIEPDADGPAGARRAVFERALGHFRRAQELNSKVGVVKSIEKLERELKRTPAEPDPEITGQAGANDN